MNERVSVVVANYNGAHLLRACLDSLRAQDYVNQEVLVVDDGSTDGSCELVATEYPEVRLVSWTRNQGFARAANAGMRAATGAIIALLNNDAAADPGWLSALVATFARHPTAGTIASKLVLWDRPGIINSVGDLVRRSGLPDSRGAWEEDRGQYDDEVEVFGGCGGAVAYRRSMLEQIGLFDERFFMYCEDVDLAYRAQYAGYRCVYSPRAVVRHRLSATGGGDLASYYVGRNVVWLLARDFPGSAWRRYWPRIIAAQAGLFLKTLPHLRETAARARLRGQLAGLLTASSFLQERAWVRGPNPLADQRVWGLLT